MKNKNILFLSSRLPYPSVGGDRLKNYWLLKILSKYFRVHLVSIHEESEVPLEFYDWVENLGISYKIFPKKKWNFYKNATKSVLNDLPLQVNYYYFKDVQHYIDTVYQDFDLIWANLIRTAEYVRNKNKPKILDIADSIGLNYLRSKEKTKSLFWKFLYTLESKRLLKYEELCIDSFDKTLFFNKDEMKYFQRPTKTVWVPHGVNEELLSYNKQDSKYSNGIVFFGKMNVQHNIDAVLWFCENVLPFLDKDKFTFYIVGANPTRKILNLQKLYPNVKVTGYIEDPYKIIKSALCVVSPLQTGGGIQNKILESMALGTVNIVSSLAAKPIGADHGIHYFIMDNPNEILNLIHQIYKSPKEFEHIRKNAREFIKNHFTWSIYEKKILKTINEVISQ